jgi:hypothetical protein
MSETSEEQAAQRERLFDELKQELLPHAHAEDRVFYSQIEQPEETRDLVLEAREEHRLIEQVLTELDEMDAGGEEWGPKLKVLKEMIEHHVEEEEGEQFKKAKKELSSEQAREIGARFLAEKQRELRGLGVDIPLGAPTDAQLEAMSKQDLYEKAKQMGIEGRSAMNKNELISALKNH